MAEIEKQPSGAWGEEARAAVERAVRLATEVLGCPSARVVLGAPVPQDNDAPGPAPALHTLPVALASGEQVGVIQASLPSGCDGEALEQALAVVAQGLAADLHGLASREIAAQRVRDLETALEAMDQAIVMVDGSGAIAVMNSRAGRWLDQPLALQVPDGDAGEDPHGARVLEARHPDGQVFEVRSHVLPDGATVQTYLDVTARRRAELAMAESEARYRLLAENTSDIVALTDERGEASYVSPAAAALLATPAEALLGPAFAEAVHAEDRQALANARNRALASAEPVRVEYRMARAGGGWLWVEAQLRRAEPDHGAGRPVLVQAIRDVSDRRAAMAAMRAAAEAKSEFLATMSHEIRSPLNAILGFTQLLAEGEGLDAVQRDRVRRLEVAGENLLAIVNDILDFSALDAGAVSLDAVPFDLRHWLERTLALVERAAAEKGLALHGEIDPSLPGRLQGDDRRLGQVLLNLVGNAVKFTRRGEVTVKCSRSVENGRDMVLCTVRDTGIGIPADKLGHVFQRFAQADGSVSREFGGSGLGLAIVSRLVALIGGTVGVESRVGEGSRFWFSFPLEEATSIAPPGPAAVEALPMTAQRVLVVDDIEMNRVLAGAMLRAAGHEVVEVESGAEALSQLRRRPFDVVLMDVQMPVMDGVEATRRIRALPPPVNVVPVVAMTAAVLTEQVAALKASGMDDHLAKPFRREEILRMVARWSKRGPAAQVAPALEEAAEAPATLEREVLRQLLTLIGPQTLQRMLGQFSERLDQLATWLPGQRPEGDYPADLTALVHQLVSSSGMLGFAALSHALRRLEEALRRREGEEEALADAAAQLAKVRLLVDAPDDLLAAA
ncbi:MAG: ATP-binding protein [Alsobacter sp.]